MAANPRARVFGAVADEYERGRPGYPADAVAWLLPGPARAVCDVGAGTGKLTRSLLAPGREVIAVEPDGAMLARLRAALPEVQALEAAAEAIPLPDGAVDAVVAGQSFHWFANDAALGELARILRAGGTLGVVWNTRADDGGWSTALWDAIEAPANEQDARRWETVIEREPRFAAVETARFTQVQRVSPADVIAGVRSRSYVATRSTGERAALVRAAERVLAEHPETRGRKQLELPYLVECYRARRR
jgi:SAM-dependent methyltransferase